MSVNWKRWFIPSHNSELQLEISKELNISPVLAQLCINRGMATVDDVKNFIRINPQEINDPFAFREMHQAISIIEETIKNHERILIYGDYDVDGITATSLLYLYLKGKTPSVAYYIPDRLEEGYGLNEDAILWANREGYKLIITVDCGISSRSEVELANSLGLKTIITDHHTPPVILPKAAAIINPKVEDSGYPFPDLAGVGVAWKLVQALEISAGKKDLSKTVNKSVVLEEYLDLVALGTVADVVPLIGENRVIVALGLGRIEKAERPGIKALLKVTGLEHKPITSGHIGFILAPRLNAAGRLAKGALAVALLTGEVYTHCESQAKELDQMNYQRQEVEGEILNQALQMIEDNVNLDQDFVIVLASESWHPGVIGIVSSRLVEKYYRPVVLLAIEGDTAKGSARSIDQFDIYQAFKHCQDLLIQFGGHKMAAGVKIKKDHIKAFQKAINDYANSFINRDLIVPTVKIDLELDPDGEEELYIKDSEMLFPYGLGNAQPVFAYRNLGVIEAKAVGNTQSHLKVTFDAGNYLLDGIGFHLAHHLSWLNTFSRVDVAVTLEKNTWNGCEKVQLVLKDIQPHINRPVTQMVRPKPEEVIWVDFRELENRENYLLELLKKNETSLIYVASQEKMEELRRLILASDLPDMKLEVCHGRKRPWQHDLVMAKVKNKIINTVIITGALPLDLISFDFTGLYKHLVFFQSPSNMKDFFSFTSLVSSPSGGKIHLLFNKRDLEILDQEIKIHFPDRELLGKIYRSVRSLASSSNQIIGSREEILRKINVEGLKKGKEIAFDTWVSIMMELGLIKFTLLGNRSCLELINNGNKCNLGDSVCYQEGMKVKEAFELWAKVALSPRFREEIYLRR
ncbi:MAG: single-stranded-DNA-specific exonuclease RecJ [Bacillota bacterium]|jgi:single-stranded-DNA-specific exonuclease